MRERLMPVLVFMMACSTAPVTPDAPVDLDSTLPVAPRIEEVAMHSNSGAIHGTLVVPAVDEPMPEPSR